MLLLIIILYYDTYAYRLVNTIIYLYINAKPYLMIYTASSELNAYELGQTAIINGINCGVHII